MTERVPAKEDSIVEEAANPAARAVVAQATTQIAERKVMIEAALHAKLLPEENMTTVRLLKTVETAKQRPRVNLAHPTRAIGAEVAAHPQSLAQQTLAILR